MPCRNLSPREMFYQLAFRCFGVSDLRREAGHTGHETTLSTAPEIPKRTGLSANRAVATANPAVSGLPGWVEGLIDSRKTCDPTLKSRNTDVGYRSCFYREVDSDGGEPTVGEKLSESY